VKLAFAILFSIFLVTTTCFAEDPVPYEFFLDDTKDIQMMNQLTIAQCSESILLHPTDYRKYDIRAMIYMHEGKFEDAIRDCNEAIRLGTNYYYSYYLRGFAYSETGAYDKAIADFNRLISLKPESPSYMARGVVYLGKGDYTNALADLNEVVRLDPTNLDAYVNRGKVFQAMGNIKKATADYSEAIHIKPDGYVYLMRGSTYGNEGNNDKAAADYTEAIQLNPQYAEAYACRGLVFSREGNYSNGIADCSRAIQIDTNCVDGYNNLAWLLAISPDANLRNGQKAVEYATRACELYSWKEPHCLGTLAAAYAEIGNFDEAIKWETKCMESGLPDKEMSQARKELDLFQHKKPYHAGK
jgi:tetratricopeptide (TPR) repeat protein